MAWVKMRAVNMWRGHRCLRKKELLSAWGWCLGNSELSYGLLWRVLVGAAEWYTGDIWGKLEGKGLSIKAIESLWRPRLLFDSGVSLKNLCVKGLATSLVLLGGGGGNFKKRGPVGGFRSLEVCPSRGFWNLVSSFFFFWWDWGLNSGFEFAKQVLCHVSHTSSPFCSGYFGNVISLTVCPGWPWTWILLISAFK
jgi:hypothetical protein